MAHSSKKDKRFYLFLFLAGLAILYLAVDRLAIVFKKGYVFRLFDRPMVVLGAARYIPKDQLNQYPPELKQSFQPIKIANTVYKKPKYEKNVRLDRVDEHTLFARDVDTGEAYKLFWSRNSGYGCASSPYVETSEGVFDPSRQDLKGIKFFFFGDSWRGILGDQGLEQLRLDLVPGDPAKLYLVSDKKDSQGRLEVLHLVLFTSYSRCVGVRDVKQAPDNSL
jgi:hypothetical protein